MANNNQSNNSNPFNNKAFGQYQEQAQQWFKNFNPNNASNVVDFKKLNEIQQNTNDALSQAYKAWFDGLQKLAKTQTELFQEQAQTAANVASKLLSATTPEAAIDHHTRYAQHHFDTNLQNAQNVAKLASDTSVKVFDIINKQAVENLNEISKINKKASNA